MKRSLARLATLAVAIPAALTLATGAASAQTVSETVPGCYGAGSNSTIVCDPTFTVQTPEPAFSVMYVKACAGPCYDIPVTYAGFSTDLKVCYSYKDGGGNTSSGCSDDISYDLVGIGSTVSIQNYVLDVITRGTCSSAFCVNA